MSEPRLMIRNVATKHLLHVGSSWNATTCSENEKGKRSALFKVQSCEEIEDKIAMNVLIRTDHHPQSLLDVRDLTYQGGTLDFQKCYDKDRWWKLTWLEVVEGGKLTVLFQSYTKGTYLAEENIGSGVEVVHIEDSTEITDIPDLAKWELTIEGRDFNAAQPGGIYLGMAAVLNKLTGRAASSRSAGLMEATFKATRATTLEEVVSTVSAIAAGRGVNGISVTTSNELHRILEKASQAFFVNWW